MITRNILFSTLMLPLMILSYTEYIKISPAILEGTVVRVADDKPIAGVYVYIVKGEEEVVTDSKGHFTLKTWQSLPVTITFETQDYETTQLKTTAQSNSLIVRLKRK